MPIREFLSMLLQLVDLEIRGGGNRTSTLVGTMYWPSTSYTQREWLLIETILSAKTFMVLVDPRKSIHVGAETAAEPMRLRLIQPSRGSTLIEASGELVALHWSNKDGGTAV
jgi:hypothetical protein